MKNSLFSCVASILAFAIFCNGLEETPEALPLSSYPATPYPFWDDLLHPIQVEARSVPSSVPISSGRLMTRPWYSSFYINKKNEFINKKNDDLARLAMRILKKRSAVNNRWDSLLEN